MATMEELYPKPPCYRSAKTLTGTVAQDAGTGGPGVSVSDQGVPRGYSALINNAMFESDTTRWSSQEHRIVLHVRTFICAFHREMPRWIHPGTGKRDRAVQDCARGRRFVPGACRFRRIFTRQIADTIMTHTKAYRASGGDRGAASVHDDARVEKQIRS